LSRETRHGPGMSWAARGLLGIAAIASVAAWTSLPAAAIGKGAPRSEPPRGDPATMRPVIVGLNKSVLIELPGDVREVVISNPAVVEAVVRTARRVHLLGQQIGQASASFIDQDGKPMQTLDISVERDLAPVAAIIRRLMPDADVRLEAMNDNIVVTGSVANPLDATRIADIAGRFVAKREQVLNMLNVEAKEQVLLRVSVVEMNRSIIRRLGIDVQQALASGNVTAVAIASSAFPVSSGTVAAAALDTATGTLSGAAAGTVLAGGWNNGKVGIDAVVQALERSGLARTLAEPNLTSVSGETAKFLAGGEYPVPVGSDKEGTTIAFKSFGVGLSFTPVVLSAGRISLNIATEVSELTTEGAVTVKEITVPALKVRRASSTLELASGASLVMAGLISSQTRRNVDGLPGLRHLPVLGALFSSEDFVRSETELVVIVTPILVRGTGRTALAAPAGTELRGLAASGGDAPAATAAGGQDYGFIIE
jgi:pilus assembly protein CpaC